MLFNAMRRCKVSTKGMLSNAAPCRLTDKETPKAVAHRLNLAKGVSGRWYTKCECRPCQNSPKPFKAFSPSMARLARYVAFNAPAEVPTKI